MPGMLRLQSARLGLLGQSDGTRSENSPQGRTVQEKSGKRKSAEKACSSGAAKVGTAVAFKKTRMCNLAVLTVILTLFDLAITSFFNCFKELLA